MMPASAAIRRTVPALTGEVDPVDLAGADPGAQFVQADPDDDGHRRQPVHRGAVAAGGMPEHLDRRVRAQLGEATGVQRPRPPFRPRNSLVVAEPHLAQVGGDDRVDGGDDVSGGFRVEEPVDPGHPVGGGGDGQGAASALPGLPGFDPVLIQPVPHLPGQSAQFRDGQGGSVFDQYPFGGVKIVRTRTCRRLWTSSRTITAACSTDTHPLYVVR